MNRTPKLYLAEGVSARPGQLVELVRYELTTEGYVPILHSGSLVSKDDKQVVISIKGWPAIFELSEWQVCVR